MAIAASACLALVSLAAFDAAESHMTAAPDPLVEPAVAAADLPLGAMYHVVDQIGARALWEQGFTGAGVNVAVIDTGTAPVESLTGAGKVVAAVDFSGDVSDPSRAFVDAHGHGTFMSGIIAGREPGADPARAAQHPEWFLGVAPDAGIVSVKVDDAHAGVDPAAIIAGIDWVVDQADELGVGVINLSLTTGSLGSYQHDALAAALERAWDAGIVVVTGAGNEGAAANGLASPANDPFLIAVAGADVSESGIGMGDFSSSGDGVRNPDLTAPGAHLDSLRAPGSDADLNHPEGFVDDETFRGSGTSQASAVIAGVAALLRQAHPDWTPDQVKAALVRDRGADERVLRHPVGQGIRAGRRRRECVRRWRDPDVRPLDRRIRGRPDRRDEQHLERQFLGRQFLGRERSSWVGNSWVGNSAGSGTRGLGTRGSGTAGSGTRGSGTRGSGTAGSGTAGSGTRGSGTRWVGNSWVGNSWVGNSWVGNSLGRELVGR